MSRTLFWYVFKDLLKVFFLTVLALAGIMSFGGLLQPLTKQGLDPGQVGRVLAYLVPAMTTYALPIAALFATTMVYGRLSADNEVTACRAGGISHLAIATPAFLLGLMVSISSVLLLCFIVPRLSLEVEKIVKSNVARLISTEIGRTHQITFDEHTIFAQSAQVYPIDPARPNEQVLRLFAPMFINYDSPPRDIKALNQLAIGDPDGNIARELAIYRTTQIELDKLRKLGLPETNKQIVQFKSQMDAAAKRAREAYLKIPKEFWMAQEATAYITNNEQEKRFTLMARLDSSAKFPRTFGGGTQVESGGIGALQYGPIELPSPVRDHPKFKDIQQLKALLADRGQSPHIREVISTFIRAEQADRLRQLLLKNLNASGAARFDTGTEIYTLTRGNAPATISGDNIIVTSGEPTDGRSIHLASQKGATTVFAADANRMRIRIVPDSASQRIGIETELYDTVVGNPGTPTPHATFPRNFNIPMPPDLQALEKRAPEFYLNNPLVSATDQQKLRRELIKLSNYIQSEMHARSSFAVSCLILVMIGASLGMMFKSGNFLSAFAVSSIPALICIALIVTGQHTVENIPDIVTNSNNPLRLGIAFIWSGNVAVLALGTTLLWRLQRQ